MPAITLPTASETRNWPTEIQVMTWALVLAVALLSFFVHTLNTAVDRGAAFNVAQHSAARLVKASSTPLERRHALTASVDAETGR